MGQGRYPRGGGLSQVRSGRPQASRARAVRASFEQVRRRWGPVRHAPRMRTGPDGASLSGPPPTAAIPGEPKRETKKDFDPWAEPEPLFGLQGRRHALSSRPGTPLPGSIPAAGAFSDPDRSSRPVMIMMADGTLRPMPGPAPATAAPPLAEPMRVEMEFEPSGECAHGLSERAWPEGLEVTLGPACVRISHLREPGRRVRLLVSARGGSRLAVHARIVRVGRPSGPRREVEAELAIEADDEEKLLAWERLLRRADGR